MRQKEKPTTTVCVECVDRDAINEFADKLDVSQRQMVTRLIETYRASLEHPRKTDTGVGPPEDILTSIRDELDKVLKRDDRIVAFIKEQERVLLKPILQSAQTTEEQIKLLNDILSNLE